MDATTQLLCAIEQCSRSLEISEARFQISGGLRGCDEALKFASSCILRRPCFRACISTDPGLPSTKPSTRSPHVNRSHAKTTPVQLRSLQAGMGGCLEDIHQHRRHPVFGWGQAQDSIGLRPSKTDGATPFCTLLNRTTSRHLVLSLSALDAHKRGELQACRLLSGFYEEPLQYKPSYSNLNP